MQPTFIRMSQLATTPKKAGRLPLHPNTIWRMCKEKRFPQPVKIGVNSTAWVMAEVEAWELAQANANRFEQV